MRITSIFSALLIVAFAVGCTSTPRARHDFALDHVGQAVLTMNYRKGESDARRVRDFSLMFYVPLMYLEPIATYEDGQPVGSARRVAPSTMRALVDELDRAAFFRDAVELHSPAVAHPTTAPPKGSVNYGDAGLPTNYPSGALEVSLTTSDGEWHRTLRHAYPLTRETGAMLLRMHQRVPPDEASDLEHGLLGKMR